MTRWVLYKTTCLAHLRAVGSSRRPPTGLIGDADRRLDTRTGVIRAALGIDGLGFLGGRYIGHPAAQRRSRAKSNGKCRFIATTLNSNHSIQSKWFNILNWTLHLIIIKAQTVLYVTPVVTIQKTAALW